MRSIEETGAKYPPAHCRIDCRKGRQMMSPLIEKHPSSPRGDCGARSVVLSLSIPEIPPPKNESDIQETHSAQREQLQVVTVSDTLGKRPPSGSLRAAHPLWCGGHISTAHCFSHRRTLSLLSNILSLLLFMADPQQSTSSHLLHLPRLLLGRAQRASYRPISHGEVWWQASSFTLARLCLSIQS